jgi:hypothetical protein
MMMEVAVSSTIPIAFYQNTKQQIPDIAMFIPTTLKTSYHIRES